MKKPLIFIFDRFDEKLKLELQRDPSINIEFVQELSKVSQDPAEVEGIVLRSRTTVDSDFLKRFPSLKIIVTATSGFDHIDFRATELKKVKTAHIPEAPVNGVVELTFLLILGALRRQKQVFQQMNKKNWDRSRLVGRELSGRTMGVVGLGRIGKKVATVAQSFGVEVLAFDPYLEETSIPGLRFLGFDELIRESEIISFHVPGTPKTRHMLHQERFDALAEDVTIINTSRGQVLHYDHLVQHLQTHPMAMAGLDVFHQEPIPRESPLYTLPNALLSPHIGASTRDCLFNSSNQAMKAIQGFFRSGELENSLPPNTHWWRDFNHS